MKKNSGAALTSVVIVFLLVIMIGIPLLGTVMYNYRLRQYDGSIKEAEYINEMVMDRIASIIKTEVIAAISEAKQNSQSNISSFSDALINSYNESYDDAYDEIDRFNNSGEEKTAEEIDEELKANIQEKLKAKLENVLNEYKSSEIGSQYGDAAGFMDIYGVSDTDIISILDYSDDMTSVSLNDELLQNLCSTIFQTNYYRILMNENKLFEEIYQEEYDDLANNVKYGREEFERDIESKKIYPSSLRVSVKYQGESLAHQKGDLTTPTGMSLYDGIKVDVKSEYKLNDLTPLTYLSATYNIRCPELSAMSSIEQQTIALSNPTLDYALIADSGLEVLANGKLFINGNLLAGIDENGVGIKLNGGSEITEDFGDSENPNVKSGRIATAGDIIMASVSGKTTKLVSGSNPIYYRNLYLGEPSETPSSAGTVSVQFNGDVLAKDDLEINSNSTVRVNQNENASYFGFNDKNDEGADSSSAIVINASNISGLNINLGNLYLAGRAFIDGVKSTNRIDTNGDPIIYKTGESVSVKGNYIAYQTPLVDTTDNKYDVEKMRFSPYFMKGSKEGIEGDTNLALSLVDNFATGSMSYKDFDSQEKWQYFRQYFLKNESTIRKPTLKVAIVKYLEGIGFNNGNLVNRTVTTQEQTNMINKGARFEEFTSYYGYVPVAEETGEISDKAKDDIKDWLKFGTSTKEIRDGEFYTYISKLNAGNKVLDFKNSTRNGIVIHDGDLTIKGDANTIFTGVIIVTGKLTIDGQMTVIADKDLTAQVIINNYLGADGYGSSLGEGTLFNTFAYDDSGTTYSIINFYDSNSNMVNINELIGISNWEKQNYGRL
jgi:hypothetical protein